MTAPWAGRAAYAVLFMVLLPLALVWWSVRLDVVVTLPPVGVPAVGAVLAVIGVLLMIEAMRALWVHGRGLPMSPFPPERLVTSGSYGLVRDPIYAGAVLLAAGLAIAFRSPAGLWIVTPVLVLMTLAWVHGFERSRTHSHFGDLPSPLLRLPEPSETPPIWHDRWATLLLTFGPWLVLYLAVETLGAPAWAPVAYLRGEMEWPVLPWTELFYAGTYPLVLLAPFVAPTRGALRRFAIGGMLATVVAIAWYLLVPVVAPAKPVPGEGFWQALMRWERSYDSPATAMPAFHLIWALLAAELYRQRWPRWRPLIVLAVLAIAASCITTGMHAVLDLLAALLVFGVVQKRAVIWQAIRGGGEGLANSWREWRVGPVRILSHGAWAGLAAGVGLGVALWLVGIGHLVGMVALMAIAILSAAVWAQVVEGSPQLLRPFGYFGSAFGATATAVVLELVWGTGWLLLAAFGAAASVAQAIGRARCLVQGCCHGRPAPGPIGIRYRHPQSRVVRLAGLDGVPLHPTPLYSMGWMLLVGAVLVRLWMAEVAPAFIVGTYFMLAGLGRFVEEHFRGEPQTATVAGLRLYQWLAIGFVVLGAAATTVSGAPPPPPAALPVQVVPILVLAAILAWVAYGVDLPGSARRFSRLT